MKNIELSELIKTAREKEGISQRELARRVKIDNAEISRIEKGTRLKPNLFVLNNLSRELKIDFVTLMGVAKYNEKEIQDLKTKISESYQHFLVDDDSREFYYEQLETDLLKLIKNFEASEISKEEFLNRLKQRLNKRG